MAYNPAYKPIAGVNQVVTTPATLTNAQLPDDVITERTIADNAIESNDFKQQTIIGADIKDGTISLAKLDPGIVVTIPDDSLESKHFAERTLESEKLEPEIIDDPSLIGQEVITGSKFEPGVITQGKVGPNSAGTIQISDKVVTNSKVLDDTIMPVKLSKSAAFVNEDMLAVDTGTGKFKTIATPAEPPRSSVVMILPSSYFVATSGAWARVGSSFYVNGLFYNTAPAITDILDFIISIAPGTYSITLCFGAADNRAILKLKLNAATIATFDMYSAIVNVYASLTVTGVAITGGEKALQILTDAKNGASSSYSANLEAITFERTGP